MIIEQLNQPQDTTEKQPADIRELKPRMRLRGKVTKAVLSGAFVDSLKGGFAAPVCFGAIPVVTGALEYAGYGGDKDRFLELARGWDEGVLIGAFLSPLLAAFFYNEGIDDDANTGKSTSAAPKWEVRLPISQAQF